MHCRKTAYLKKSYVEYYEFNVNTYKYEVKATRIIKLMIVMCNKSLRVIRCISVAFLIYANGVQLKICILCNYNTASKSVFKRDAILNFKTI